MSWQVILILLAVLILAGGYAILAILLMKEKRKVAAEQAKRMIAEDALARYFDLEEFRGKTTEELRDGLLEKLRNYDLVDRDGDGSDSG